MQNITKITLVWELFEERVPQLHVARRVGVDRVTVYRWIRGNEPSPQQAAWYQVVIPDLIGNLYK